MKSWADLDELEAAAVDYQSNWWRSNPEALAFIDDAAANPGLRGQIVSTSGLGQLVTTSAVYRPSHPGAPDDRPYAPVRQPVHEAIVADCVPPAGQIADEPPIAYFTIGCPGAGKTSVLREVVQRHRSNRSLDEQSSPLSVIDADRVRQLLPEYADGLGSLVVQEECFWLTYSGVFDQAVERGVDMVYDTIGRLSSIRENLDTLRDEGFQIHMLLAQSSPELCQERTERRALTVDGRIVNPGILQRCTEDAAQAIGALIGEGATLSGWAKVDTTDMAVSTLIDGTDEWVECV